MQEDVLINGSEGSAPVLKLNGGKKELAKVLNPFCSLWNNLVVWRRGGGVEAAWAKGKNCPEQWINSMVLLSALFKLTFKQEVRHW